MRDTVCHVRLLFLSRPPKEFPCCSISGDHRVDPRQLDSSPLHRFALGRGMFFLDRRPNERGQRPWPTHEVFLPTLRPSPDGRKPWSNARLVPPRPQSPHWEHIAISDFARGYYWTGDLTKDADRQWLAARIDLSKEFTRDPYVQAMRQWNPTLAVFQYRLDHYDFVNDQSRAFPESRVLHISTPTRMMLKGRDIAGQELSFASGDRFSSRLERSLLCLQFEKPGHPSVEHRSAPRRSGWSAGTFSRCARARFSSLIGITNGQTRITNGGAIVEYGDRIPTDPVLIQDYQKDMVTWWESWPRVQDQGEIYSSQSSELHARSSRQTTATCGTGNR